MTTVTFNAANITRDYIVMNVQRPFAVRTHQLVNVPGRNGAVLGNSTFDVVEITMDIGLAGDSRANRATELRDLAAILNTDSPVQLSFSDDAGKYYLAMGSGGNQTMYINADRIEGVTFTCPDPIMFGASRTESFSGGSATISTLGNMPCDVSLQFSTVSGNSDNLFIVQDDTTGFQIEVPIPSGTTPTVSIDCKTRSVLVGGVSAVPTIASDWFEGFTAGSRTFSIFGGSGTGTITVQDRWV